MTSFPLRLLSLPFLYPSSLKLEVGNIEEDEYVLAMEGYIKDLLLKNEKKGEYELYYGEYEELKEGKVCLSGAITGDKEYYVRCLIVKSVLFSHPFLPFCVFYFQAGKTSLSSALGFSFVFLVFSYL